MEALVDEMLAAERDLMPEGLRYGAAARREVGRGAACCRAAAGDPRVVAGRGGATRALRLPGPR